VHGSTAIGLTAAGAAYLLGSIPFGLLVARCRGIDIRTVGSCNIGATNVFRSVGKAWGILTFVLDFLKGLIPALGFPGLVSITGHIPHPLLGLACAACAIAGHNWPVFLRFKGGKGVATGTGALVGIAPWAILVGVAAWIILFLLGRYVSVASIGAALAFAGASWWWYRADGIILPAVLTGLAALVILRHHTNIRRLLNGTEHRFNFSRKQPSTGSSPS